MKKPHEVAFTLPDGSKRYAFIDLDNGIAVLKQIAMFMKMHGAVSARPVAVVAQIGKDT